MFMIHEMNTNTCCRVVLDWLFSLRERFDTRNSLILTDLELLLSFWTAALTLPANTSIFERNRHGDSSCRSCVQAARQSVCDDIISSHSWRKGGGGGKERRQPVKNLPFKNPFLFFFYGPMINFSSRILPLS